MMRLRKVVGLLLLLLLMGIIGVPGWVIYRDIRQDYLNHALIAAVKRDDTSEAIALLNEGADANAHDEPQRRLVSLWQFLMNVLHHRQTQHVTAPTALQIAVGSLHWGAHLPGGVYISSFLPENPMLIKALLDHGARVNVEDSDGPTPLLLAAGWGYTHTVALLLSHGAAGNRPDSKGLTPLVYAVEHPGTLSCLLEHGASINAQGEGGWTALLKAAFYGKTDTVRVLLNHHADVNLKTEGDDTALSLANIQSQPAIVHLLKQAGAKQ